MLEQIGTTIRAYDLHGEDVGQIQLPAPVLVGDVAAFEHGPSHEIVSVLQDDEGRPVAVKLRPVRLHVGRRR